MGWLADGAAALLDEAGGASSLVRAAVACEAMIRPHSRPMRRMRAVQLVIAGAAPRLLTLMDDYAQSYVGSWADAETRRADEWPRRGGIQ